MNAEDGPALDQRGSITSVAPELAQLPHGTEVFGVDLSGLLLLYNVSEARALTQERAPAVMIDAVRMAELTYVRGTQPAPSEGFEVVPEWAMMRDLSQPLILVQRAEGLGGNPEGLLIDGWHRVYKAAKIGVRELPAVVITAEEEPSIRIAPDDESIRQWMSEYHG